MAKATQSYSLFQLLKSGNTVKKEEIATALGIKLPSVPVYIHELKKQHKAEIVLVREGRKILGYKLINKKEVSVSIPQFRKNRKSVLVTNKNKKQPVTKGVVAVDSGELPVLDKEVDTKFNEREFADIADSLGISGGGNGLLE